MMDASQMKRSGVVRHQSAELHLRSALLRSLLHLRGCLLQSLRRPRAPRLRLRRVRATKTTTGASSTAAVVTCPRGMSEGDRCDAN